MSFAQPWLLAVLVLPAALVWRIWQSPGKRLVLPFDRPASQDAGRGRALACLLRAGESLAPAALAVAILLLAGPQSLSAPRVERSLTNIEFCVDVSGSMSADFGGRTRYDASMQAINEFLDYREGDAFGLTFFGNAVLHWVPLTSDVSAFRCAPPFMQPSSLPRWFNGTEIGKALLACRDILTAREEGDRMIVLISDGYSADLNRGRDLEIARKLVADGIVVYAVHVASGGVPDSIVNLTRTTGGEIFNPGDKAALSAVFKQIDAMQVTKLEKRSAEYVDHFTPFCIAGLALLALHALFQLGLRVTPW